MDGFQNLQSKMCIGLLLHLRKTQYFTKLTTMQFCWLLLCSLLANCISLQTCLEMCKIKDHSAMSCLTIKCLIIHYSYVSLHTYRWFNCWIHAIFFDQHFSNLNMPKLSSIMQNGVVCILQQHSENYNHAYSCN